MARLKATTLIEPIVAMLVILISVMAAMMIYMNVLTNERIESRSKTQLVLCKLLEDAKRYQQVSEEIIAFPGWTVEKTAAAYQGYPDAYLLHLKAYDGRDRLIGELKEVVYFSPAGEGKE